MATDTVRDALNRLKEWGETIRHYNTRTVVGGGGDTRAQWVGHEEFFADLDLLTQRLAAMEALAPDQQWLQMILDMPAGTWVGDAELRTWARRWLDVLDKATPR